MKTRVDAGGSGRMDRAVLGIGHAGAACLLLGVLLPLFPAAATVVSLALPAVAAPAGGMLVVFGHVWVLLFLLANRWVSTRAERETSQSAVASETLQEGLRRTAPWTLGAIALWIVALVSIGRQEGAGSQVSWGHAVLVAAVAGQILSHGREAAVLVRARQALDDLGGPDLGGADRGKHDLGGADRGKHDLGGADRGKHDLGGADRGKHDLGGRLA